MDTKKEKVFVDGMIFKAKSPNAPEFIKGSLSVKVEEFPIFLKKHNNKGWVNIDIKQSQGGKFYLELNTFKLASEVQEQNDLAKHDATVKPVSQGVPLEEGVEYPTSEINPEDIPF